MKTAFIVITIHRIAETVSPAVSQGAEEKILAHLQWKKKFLHISSPIRAARVAEPTSVETLSVSKSSYSDVYMPVCAARVKDFDATVLLDSALTHTSCTNDFIHSVRITGQSTKYTLSTLAKSNKSVTSEMVNFDVLSEDGAEVLSLKNVIVVEKIPVHSPRTDVTKYKQVHILIGQDHV